MAFYRALELATEEWELDAMLSSITELQSAAIPTPPATPPAAFRVLGKGSKQQPAKPYEKRLKWTSEDDQLLKAIVPRLKPDWKQIADHFPGRPKSVVRRRWENRFDPNIKKTPWTEEEDAAILMLLSTVGPSWKEIATHLPGRPPDAVKNRYYGHLKRLQSPLKSTWEDLITAPLPASSTENLADGKDTDGTEAG